MPTSLPTTGAASGFDAWQELEDVLSRLGQLARSPIDPVQFYEHTLVECVRALSAAGGAAWLRSPGGALRPVASVNWPNAEIAASADSRRAYETQLTNAANAGRVVTSAAGTLIAPVQIAADETDAAAAPATVAILEIVPRGDASPSALRGYEHFLAAVGDLAGEYHSYRELARLRRDENYHDDLVRFGTLVHRSIELLPTAYAVANEGRRVIGCDRLSVLAAVGRRSRLIATSGSARIECRSAAARQMERLAELVRPTAEPAWYSDGQIDALPPIADALEAHAEQFHARRVAVIPLTLPAPGELASVTRDTHVKRREKPAFTLIAEQFDARTGDFTRERLAEVAEVSTTALYNALEVDQLPLRWILRPVAKAKRQIVGHLARSIVIAAIATAAIAALVIVPTDFNVNASGTLEPAVRRDVFAPRSGLVDEVLVTHGTDVAAGQPLVALRDPSLELELKRVHGEMETVRRQLDAVRATKTSRELRDANPVEFYRLSASEREFEQQLANLEGELALLNHERNQLVVRSPIAGRVLTWDPASRLTARPVERGESLLTVADLSADWQLELEVADDRIGHVLAAQKAAGDSLPVRFRLRSADLPHDGQIKTIGLTANVDAKVEAAARPTVEVIVAFDKSQLDEAAQREMRPGLSARAQIDCGQRSLGYVWLHDLWDTALTWLRL